MNSKNVLLVFLALTFIFLVFGCSSFTANDCQKLCHDDVKSEYGKVKTYQAGDERTTPSFCVCRGAKD